jgi:hypothetical protein
MSTRKHPPRGEKQDYPKIDLYYDGHYKATTTWSRTCAEAKEHFHKAHPSYALSKIVARFQR